MVFSSENPFVGPVPASIRLPKSPLTGVLVQVRFPEILSIGKAEFIADYQECIRADYPFHKLDQEPYWELNDDRIRQGLVPNWRFTDQDRQWRLSLTTSFVSLETRAYRNRVELIERTYSILQALSETVKPSMTLRVGVRFMDRFYGPHWKNLSRNLRPEILGAYSGNYRENFSRTFNEIACDTDVGSMISRWGYMPANQTHEPEMLPPVSEPSWFLDTDSYREFAEPEDFDVERVKVRVSVLAHRAYGFFRWAVSDEFLKDCGGEI